MFTGYACLSLAYNQKLPGDYALLSFFNLISGMGAAACYHTSLATNLRNWPAYHRGIAVGIPVASFGLSAFIFTGISKLFFMTEGVLRVGRFLWVMAASCLGLAWFAALTLRDLRPSYLRDGKHPEEEEALNDLIVEESHLETSIEGGTAITSSSESDHSWHDTTSVPSHTSSSKPDATESFKLYLFAEAYLVGLSMLCLVGVGLMYVNNVGSIVRALVPASESNSTVQADQSFQVGLLSVASFTGRFLSGIASDIAYRKWKLNRLFWLFLAALLLLTSSIFGSQLQTLDQITAVTIITGAR